MVSSFLHHLELNHFQEEGLLKCLALLTAYPCLQFSNSHLLAIYKTVCFNLHLKSVETLNHLLQLVLLTDLQISQSPVYHEFIRFYLQVPSEEYRVKYQMDFDKLSVLAALRQLVARMAQRGFFPLSPGYTRNLNVLDPSRVLFLLANRSSTR